MLQHRRVALVPRRDSQHFAGGGIAFLLLAFGGTIAAALRTHRDWRRWHWLTFGVSGPVLAAAWFAAGRLLYGTGSSNIWIPVGCVATLACALDLRRKRSTGPGRIVAWSVLAISLAVVIIFAAA